MNTLLMGSRGAKLFAGTFMLPYQEALEKRLVAFLVARGGGLGCVGISGEHRKQRVGARGEQLMHGGVFLLHASPRPRDEIVAEKALPLQRGFTGNHPLVAADADVLSACQLAQQNSVELLHLLCGERIDALPLQGLVRGG